jgi:hypothetical protein
MKRVKVPNKVLQKVGVPHCHSFFENKGRSSAAQFKKETKFYVQRRHLQCPIAPVIGLKHKRHRSHTVFSTLNTGKHLARSCYIPFVFSVPYR